MSVFKVLLKYRSIFYLFLFFNVGFVKFCNYFLCCKWFYLLMVNVIEKYIDFLKKNVVCSILSRFNICISLIVFVELVINK